MTARTATATGTAPRRPRASCRAATSSARPSGSAKDRAAESSAWEATLSSTSRRPWAAGSSAETMLTAPTAAVAAPASQGRTATGRRGCSARGMEVTPARIGDADETSMSPARRRAPRRWRADRRQLGVDDERDGKAGRQRQRRPAPMRRRQPGDPRRQDAQQAGGAADVRRGGQAVVADRLEHPERQQRARGVADEVDHQRRERAQPRLGGRQGRQQREDAHRDPAVLLDQRGARQPPQVPGADVRPADRQHGHEPGVEARRDRRHEHERDERAAEHEAHGKAAEERGDRVTAAMLRPAHESAMSPGGRRRGG